MYFTKGITPAITATILIGAVLLIGISFMGFSITISNIQSSEIRLRNIVINELASAVIYVEYEDISGDIVNLYLGLIRMIPENTAYYLIIFKSTTSYRSLYELTPIDYVSGIRVSKNIPATLLAPASKIYVLDEFGNQVPLNLLGIDYLTAYQVDYTPLSTLIKIVVNKYDVGYPNYSYIVSILLTEINGEYYEVARITYVLR